MSIYEFMGESPFLTFFLGLILFNVIKHIIRHFNIRKHGWPPEHCDADGDFRDEDDE